jgi:hypothetical protein
MNSRTGLWPAACAAAFAGGAALDAALEYRRLIARHAWTAATLWIALGACLIFFWGALGAVLGRSVQELLDEPREGRSRVQPYVLIAAVGLFAVTACFKRAAGRRRAVRLDAAQRTLERRTATAP